MWPFSAGVPRFAGSMPLKWYNSLLASRPFATNVGTSMVIMLAGDLLAQWIETSRSEKGGFAVDAVRSAKMLTWVAIGEKSSLRRARSNTS